MELLLELTMLIMKLLRLLPYFLFVTCLQENNVIINFTCLGFPMSHVPDFYNPN